MRLQRTAGNTKLQDYSGLDVVSTGVFTVPSVPSVFSDCFNVVVAKPLKAIGAVVCSLQSPVCHQGSGS